MDSVLYSKDKVLYDEALSVPLRRTSEGDLVSGSKVEGKREGVESNEFGFGKDPMGFPLAKGQGGGIRAID
ncbi:hypothetical protein CK203_017922 [Vitis vinifera]|uniref:Uncharacterized protein n=1 Tax=Vitis vinifera TaxID=29760 RepID=A0A438JWB7_VITVI|nr:hypothetical protein CK203_017922 [Vitis vinifera]